MWYFSTNRCETSLADSPSQTTSFSLTPSPRFTSIDSIGLLCSTTSSLTSPDWIELSLSLLVRFLPDSLVSNTSRQQPSSPRYSSHLRTSSNLRVRGWLADLSLTARRCGLETTCAQLGIGCLRKDGLRVWANGAVFCRYCYGYYSTILMLLVRCNFFSQVGLLRGYSLLVEQSVPQRMRLTRRARYYSYIYSLLFQDATILRLWLIMIFLEGAGLTLLWEQKSLGQQWFMQPRNQSRLLLGTPPQPSPYNYCHKRTKYFSSSIRRRQCNCLRIWKHSYTPRKHSVSRRCSCLLWSSPDTAFLQSSSNSADCGSLELLTLSSFPFLIFKSALSKRLALLGLSTLRPSQCRFSPLKLRTGYTTRSMLPLLVQRERLSFSLTPARVLRVVFCGVWREFLRDSTCWLVLQEEKTRWLVWTRLLERTVVLRARWQSCQKERCFQGGGRQGTGLALRTGLDISLSTCRVIRFRISQILIIINHPHTSHRRKRQNMSSGHCYNYTLECCNIITFYYADNRG